VTGAADPDRHLSVETGPETELRAQGSVFLGQALRADSEADASSRLAEIRRRHHDATHHCWAQRIGPPDACVERADDDGEPSGTAGAPILAELRRAPLHDALVVVTRWFGGTKLGRGGLSRAYAGAARAAIDAAPERVLWRESRVTARCAWNDVGAVEATLARHADDVRRCERDFTDAPRFVITVLRSRTERLCAVLREETAGRIEFFRDTAESSR